MNEEQFIRNRIKQAREDMGLSKRDMAKLYGTSQSKISDIERGRVQITALQIIEFAKMLKKPINYFFPSDITKDTTLLESKLLDIFRTLPEDWQERALSEVKRQVELYQRVQPYIRAGIPEELFDMLLFDEMQLMDVEDSLEDDGTYDERAYKEQRRKLDNFLTKHFGNKRGNWTISSGGEGISEE